MKPWFANQSLVTILFLRIFHHLKHSLPKTSASPYSSVIIMTILSEMKMNIRKYGIILTPMNRIGLRTDFICIDANNRVALDVTPSTITSPPPKPKHKDTFGNPCVFIYTVYQPFCLSVPASFFTIAARSNFGSMKKPVSFLMGLLASMNERGTPEKQ